MVEFAASADNREIRALWDICFPEEPEFNDWFFNNKFDVRKCLVLREDGIIKAMAQLLPYEISGVGKVRYIYGAATHPDHRRLGLMRKLLEHSFEIDKANGFAASILIPASKSLFDFYEGLGYKTCFYIGRNKVEALDVSGYSLREATASDIPFMDKLYTSQTGENHIIRSQAYWVEQIKMFSKLGGKVYILMYEDKPIGYGFVTDGFVQEGFGEVKMLANLAEVNNYNTCGTDTPIGMAYTYNDNFPKNMYLNLMFN
jgi:GNAT superfamily N-acetyltransferase